MAGIPSLTNWAAQYYSNYVGSRHCFSRFYKPEKFSQDFKSRYWEFRLCVIEHCWNRATKYIPFSFRQAFSKRIHGGGLAFPLYQLDFLIFFCLQTSYYWNVPTLHLDTVTKGTRFSAFYLTCKCIKRVFSLNIKVHTGIIFDWAEKTMDEKW